MAVKSILPDSEIKLLAILFVVFLLTRLPLLGYMPLVKDEALYAIMVEEQAHHLTVLPTFLGYLVDWKPPVFYWVYSFLVHFPLPLEAAYRAPSLIFSLLTIPVLFRTLRNLGMSKAITFFTMVIFLVSLPSINPAVSLLIDALNFFLIATSLWLYTEPKFGSWRFIAAGALGFAAFFTKLIIAFMVPILALAYFYFNDRKKLKNPVVLVSLLAVPIAFLANMALLTSIGMKSDVYTAAFESAAPFQITQQLGILMGSVTIFMVGAGLWFALSIMGLIKHWREEKFMACWYAMIIFPIITGTYMIWYYLPVMPAVAFFAALILVKWNGEDKTDLFFAIFFSIFVIATVALIGYIYFISYDLYNPEKEAGLYLAGKENVAIIGSYAPTLVATKMLTELRTSGKILDFGWVVAPGTMDEGTAESFASDYWTSNNSVTQGDFNDFFANFTNYRKDTNISRFDYIVLTGNYTYSPPGYSIVFNRTDYDNYSDNRLAIFERD